MSGLFLQNLLNHFRKPEGFLLEELVGAQGFRHLRAGLVQLEDHVVYRLDNSVGARENRPERAALLPEGYVLYEYESSTGFFSGRSRFRLLIRCNHVLEV